ncbi:ATP-binding protein [Enterococcus faecium]|uniref:AAA family ATPase n=2 Tax=Enterococcus faecium TaxID=1352 RepID=UPI0009B4B354|nr:AAA family ATPase [Enterococcus faecium]MCZ1193330.1 ATP-binding protein [Enterococcus faecium]MCZ1196917.1 ATP-binding protein [Enterococcus faecium]MCZ1206692.1 ATP-binding protein [Enterococcus faecium]MCZ1223558.1 ATP-binding protein [Enterococcus faecium]MCZ1242550.1 ATP-binding protein [Enterococcus faecium]
MTERKNYSGGKIMKSNIKIIAGDKMKEKENLVWYFNRNPHMLITGRTATGKTYLLKRMADYLSQVGIVSASFDKTEFEEILSSSRKEMEDRFEYIKENRFKMFDVSYSDLDMKPYFVLIDELDSRLLLLEKENPLAYNYLLLIIKDIVLKGRVVGVFFIAVRQGKQPLLESIEDNMLTRIFLGDSKGNGTICFDGNTKKFQTELVTEDFFSVDC